MKRHRLVYDAVNLEHKPLDEIEVTNASIISERKSPDNRPLTLYGEEAV